jgi:hypothetical protein
MNEIAELERVRDFVIDEFPPLMDKVTVFKKELEAIVVTIYGHTDLAMQEFLDDFVLLRAGMRMAKERLVRKLSARVYELEGIGKKGGD